MTKRTALLSVSDKTGIVDFARQLTELGFDLISTGGTYRTLAEAGVPNLRDIAEFTGFPEGLEGRIKTLTPQVFGALLAKRDDPNHLEFCEQNNIGQIDLVVVNLYPFKAAYYDENKDFSAKVEQIDIGGPSMIRAAAKNYQFCAPVVDPTDYDRIIAEYQSGGLSEKLRQQLAAKVFAMTSHYDILISKLWLEQDETTALRYGENPHQSAVVVPDPFADGANLVSAELLNGKPLSYNNLNDAHAALELGLSVTDQPFATIIKHSTPCGAAIGGSIEEAFQRAYEADSISAFGGVICVNQAVSKELAEKITSFFNEIVIAPAVEAEALEVFKTKPNLRVLVIKDFVERANALSLKSVAGGTLVQDADTKTLTAEDLACVTEAQPEPGAITDALLAWKLVKIVKSNAIVVVKDGIMLGKGGGQTSRVEAVEIALSHAGASAEGAVLASDAFFPFPDSVELAAKSGIKTIVQPGGSRKDDEVIAKADELGVSMVTTGFRAFLH